ncbi:HD-GYP domain-containing protein [Ureibacillus acetophenoni]|uniref:HD-GYP domain-containing protein (C-di-GMP phosphodiesterase class II) n=1 Tax=Ureibacillus acetophenoni TaxID=614649 RepID=A0A285UDF2_9BACL|nr:HD-GYP domain-containing protein [Ureibacillus acetophenoni]SOC39428.1 HD-GYP domain-containing protein (c-di-GMP phosphodiesterase class II) [Ureibacillus acetophenoni]
MDASYVQVDESYLGKIVAEDIFANTRRPIVTKNSIITPELLHVLKVFQVQKVLILKENRIENEKTTQENLNKVDDTYNIIEDTFKTHYLEAVSQFKKEFTSWQSLAKVDIVKIRGIILPLVEEILSDRTRLFDLNQYSNPIEYTYHHSIATGLISAVLAQKLGYDKGTTLQMAIAGTLADSGMSKIPPRIIEKKGALIQSEFTEIRKHPVYSYQMVKDLPALKDNMKKAIIEHHERLDGSGYPRGLKIDNISPFSQIIAVADTFHAMTSERSYRAKESPFKVVELIKENEFGKFDIRVVQALMSIVVDLPIGMKVELSNLERAEVMFINKYSPTRPLVKLLKTGEIIDLSTDRNLYIIKIITN